MKNQISNTKSSDSADRDLHLGYGIRNEEERNYSSLVKIKTLKVVTGFSSQYAYSSDPPILIELKFKNEELVGTSQLCILKEIGKEWESWTAV